jgi:hypothetical protein
MGFQKGNVVGQGTCIQSGRGLGIRKPRSAREMTEPEQAYIGALIDGEGCVHLRENRGITIDVTNTEVELISACLRATGCGSVSLKNRAGDVPRAGRWCLHDAFVWYVYRHNDIDAIARQCAPWSMKCQRALEWLADRALAGNEVQMMEGADGPEAYSDAGR